MSASRYPQNNRTTTAGSTASREEAPAEGGAAQAEGGSSQDQRIRIDGFNQVLEMLRVADPAFRESLLRNLAKRDPRLALNLRRDLE